MRPDDRAPAVAQDSAALACDAARRADRFRHAATASVIAMTCALLASPALAQQVTVFSEDFESYTSNATLPNGGATDLWASASTGNTVMVQTGASSQFLYAQGGGGVQATTVTMDSRGISAQLKFDVRFTGSDGLITVSNPTDGSIVFNEFDNASDEIKVEYTTDGSTYTTLQQFAFNNQSYSNGFGTVTISLPSLALRSTLQLRFNQASGGGANVDQWAVDNVSVVVTTPEPATWALFGLGVAGLGTWVRRRRRLAAA